jgi:hypothetical protein
MRNTHRGYRAVIFSITGNVISRGSLDDYHKTSKAALKELDALIDSPAMLQAAAEDLAQRAKCMARDAKTMAALARRAATAARKLEG